MEGLWLPIITPFRNGKVDYESYRALLNHYIDQGITGIMGNGTTGESPVLTSQEQLRLIECSLETIDNRVPFYWGAGGNNTLKVSKEIEELTKTGIDGLLSVSPYYSRPSQDGIFEHFKIVAESTNLPIILYNIPYRTGMNMENDLILELSKIDNIVGIKDSSGDIFQSIDLIKNSPKGFHVYTGDDLMYFINLVLGGSGGIMASSHLDTKKYLSIYRLIKENKHIEARDIWDTLSGKIPYLFKETNPGPIKYLLKRESLITSQEVRLPLKKISLEYEKTLEKVFI